MWKQIAVWQVVLSVGFFIYNPVNLSNLYAKKAEISVASMCSLTAGWPGLSFVTNGHTIPHCRRNTHNRHNTIHTTRQKAHTCCLNIFINMQHAYCTNQDVCHWQTSTKYDNKLYNELFTGRDKSEHVESTSHEWRRPFKDNWKDWSDCPHVCAQWQEEWGGRYFVLTLLPH